MRRGSIARNVRVLGWCVILGIMIWIWLNLGRLVYPGILSLELPGGMTIPSGHFITLFILAWFGIPFLTSVLPKRWNTSVQITAVIAAAVIARLLLLPMALSGDVEQFIVNGRHLLEGHCPDIAGGGVQTCLQTPLILCLAGVSCILKNSPHGWRFLVLAGDLLVLVLIILELRQRRLPVRHALIYAVHPLVLASFAGQGHPDVFLLLFLLLSLQSYRKNRFGRAFLFLGLAAQVRLYPLFLWPLLLHRHSLKKAWITPAVSVVPWIPFLFTESNSPHIIRHLTAGLSFSFNSALHGLIEAITGNLTSATIAAFIIFLTILCILVFRMHPSRLRGSPLDIITVSIIVYVSYFLLTPIVYPWYLTLFVLLLALRPMISLALLTLTVSASYTVFGYLHTTGEWHYPVAAQLIVWVPFILFFMLEIRRILFGRRQGLRKPYGQRISIIIPAYNEQHIIRECIEHAADEVLEIIVVDGGSTDSTVDAALDAGARVIVHELPFTEGGGRGGQIHAGLIEAAGDIAVILHAETLLRPGQMRLIKEIMALNPELSGGAIGIEFEQATFRSELMITATDLVSGCFGLTMGGQVQFFRREWVLASGIFPDIPLMEDIELSMRLKSLGPTIYLWESTVSRGYLAKRQSWNRVILIIRLATAWLIHRMLGSPDPVAFFKTYYKK